MEAKPALMKIEYLYPASPLRHFHYDLDRAFQYRYPLSSDYPLKVHPHPQICLPRLQTEEVIISTYQVDYQQAINAIHTMLLPSTTFSKKHELIESKAFPSGMPKMMS